MPISRRFKCVAFLVERGANRSHCISGGTNLPDRAASYYPACSAFTYQVSHRAPPAFRIKVSIKQHRLSGLRMHIPGTRPHCYTKHQRLFLRNEKSGLGFCSGFVARSSPAPDKGPQSLSTHVDRPDHHKMISPFDSAAGSLCPPSSMPNDRTSERSNAYVGRHNNLCADQNNNTSTTSGRNTYIFSLFSVVFNVNGRSWSSTISIDLDVMEIPSVEWVLKSD